MKKFEYIYVQCNSKEMFKWKFYADMALQMNKMGDAGWEVVSITIDEKHKEHYAVIFYKREKFEE